jgi:hypothetical protein
MSEKPWLPDATGRAPGYPYAAAAALELVISEYGNELIAALERKRSEIVAGSESDVDLAAVLADLLTDLEIVSKVYISRACDMGVSRALSDLQKRGWVPRIVGEPRAAASLVDSIVAENLSTMRTSLIPAIQKKFFKRRSVETAIDSMVFRTRSYSNFLWGACESRCYVATAKQCSAMYQPKRSGV